MIYVTLGSQKFQFNRLLIMIDQLIEREVITEDVFAQTGYSSYVPLNYKYKDFLDRKEYKSIISKSDIVVTHGGTGAIIGATKEKKRIIGIARLEKYGEHVDNHQEQIINQFKKMNIIRGCNNIAQLEREILNIRKFTFQEYHSNTKKIIDSIDEFI